MERKDNNTQIRHWLYFSYVWSLATLNAAGVEIAGTKDAEIIRGFVAFATESWNKVKESCKAFWTKSVDKAGEIVLGAIWYGVILPMEFAETKIAEIKAWNERRREAAEALRLQREKEEEERKRLEEEALALMGERPHFLQRFVTWINLDRDEKNLEAQRLMVREELAAQQSATDWNDLVESEDVLPTGQYDELPVTAGPEPTVVSVEEVHNEEPTVDMEVDRDVPELSDEEAEEDDEVLFLRVDLDELKEEVERRISELRESPADEREQLIILAAIHSVPLEAWWNRHKIRKEIERKLGL